MTGSDQMTRDSFIKLIKESNMNDSDFLEEDMNIVWSNYSGNVMNFNEFLDALSNIANRKGKSVSDIARCIIDT